MKKILLIIIGICIICCGEEKKKTKKKIVKMNITKDLKFFECNELDVGIPGANFSTNCEDGLSKIPNFKLLNHNGDTITNHTLEGQNYILHFSLLLVLQYALEIPPTFLITFMWQIVMEINLLKKMKLLFYQLV